MLCFPGYLAVLLETFGSVPDFVGYELTCFSTVISRKLFPYLLDPFKYLLRFFV